MIDHDHLFKELLTTFFLEFVDLFLPEVSSYLERQSLVFLDKEVFTDVTSGDRYEADQEGKQEEARVLIIRLLPQRIGTVDPEFKSAFASYRSLS